MIFRSFAYVVGAVVKNSNCLDLKTVASIMKGGHGRSMSGRSAETVVQQDRHVHSSGEPPYGS